jgi:hypothetical protein
VLGDLTEQDLIVTCPVGIDSLAGFGGSYEVKPLALELDLFSVSYEELFVASVVLDLPTLVDLVLGLVVDKDPRIPSSCEEAVEDNGKLGISKYF